jgi:hypothetical protein
MTDEELRAQAPGLPVLYFDGYGAFEKVNGVLRCVGWTFGLGGQYNIISSLAGADIAIKDAALALREVKPAACIKIWNGTALAH